jgi:pyruvate kinase
MSGEVIAADDDQFTVRISNAAVNGARLRAAKGINLPDTVLPEAAHLPVIWATQVLDQLARTGRPSRAEITDAAMGVRAECVMLNKGQYTSTGSLPSPTSWTG